MKVLYFDCFSGMSGDMTVGALIDLGVDPAYIEEELKKLHLKDEYELRWEKVVKKGITATQFHVILKDGAQDQHVHHSHDFDEEKNIRHAHSDHHEPFHLYSHQDLEHGSSIEPVHHHEPEMLQEVSEPDGLGLTMLEQRQIEDFGHTHDVHQGIHGHDHKHKQVHDDHPNHSHDHHHEHGHSHSHQREVHEHSHDHSHSHGDHTHSHHSHRHYSHIAEMIRSSDLNEKVVEISLRIFEKIARAEGKIHNLPIEEVHFHEVGAIDSIVDIVATAIAIDQINPDVIQAAPVPVGSGTIRIDHGVYPVPAPATLDILKGVPIKHSELKFEQTTPTGAGILAALVDEFSTVPSMRVEEIGYGAGTKNIPDRPNVLRVMVGELVD